MMRRLYSFIKSLQKRRNNHLEITHDKLEEALSFSDNNKLIDEYKKTKEVVSIKKLNSTYVIKENKPNKNKVVTDRIRQAKFARDVTELMEFPFLSLSKNRTNPIIYEKKIGDDFIKIKVSRHSEHYLASIYDWDIVLFLTGRIQKILNDGTDIPPKTIVVARHELFKAIHKNTGGKQELDISEALYRLQSTVIDTTVGNIEYKKGKVFSFLDSWGYTERQDIKELEITLSDWLYHMVCANGALLMVDPEYFNIKSGIKKFLYRTARKHAGNKEWEFLIETLYEKSGSEMELKKFKSILKKIAAEENDIPGYILEWNNNTNKYKFISKNFNSNINRKIKINNY